jgi:hypothetical protein
MCLGAGAAGAPYLAMMVSPAARGVWGVLGAAPPPTPSRCASERENAAPVVMTFSA